MLRNKIKHESKFFHGYVSESLKRISILFYLCFETNKLIQKNHNKHLEI